MSDASGFSFDDLERKITRFQFRFGRKHRFRIYRKLEGMLRMNEALSRALDRLYLNSSEMGKYPRRPAAVALRDWFLKDRAGVTLAEAMEGWVPTGELYMIRAGEESGTLPKALSAIQAMGEKARQMREAVIFAVGYPAFMVVLLSFVLYMFGVQLIDNMRKSAPANVMAAMGGVATVSDFIKDWGLWVLAGILVFMHFDYRHLAALAGPAAVQIRYVAAMVVVSHPAGQRVFAWPFGASRRAGAFEAVSGNSRRTGKSLDS